MTSIEQNESIPPSWPWWRWMLTGLNILALVLSMVLSWHSLAGGSMIGCGGGSPCDQLLNSRWSMLAGVLPVSGLAMGAYLAMLVSAFFIGPSTEASVRVLAWKIMLVLAGVIFGSALWFTAVQIWIIGDFCFYCMSLHSTGLLLSALIVWRAQRSKIRSIHIWMTVLLGLVMAGILVVFQVGSAPETVYQDGESPKELPIIDYTIAPMLGTPDAPYIVTVLFDYQCSHCQTLHFMLIEAVKRNDGRLAFALCPSPLNSACNPYVPQNTDAFKSSCELARTGLAVWLAEPAKFNVFENWMFSFESGNRWQPRSLEKAKEKAIELVGRKKFETALSDPWIGEYLETSTQLYGRTIRNGRGGIPKLIFGDYWVIPQPTGTDDLIHILQNSLGVPGF